MGHIGHKGLCAMHIKGMVEDIPDGSKQDDFCEHCIYGKQSHVRFSFCVTRAKEIPELIHSDVFRAMPLPSLGGSCIL